MMNSQDRRRGARAVLALAAGLAAMAPLAARAQDAAGQRMAPASGAVPAGSPARLEPGLPATTPMTDLLTRMDALEAQVARLTAQNEELANRQHQIETRLGANPAAGASASNPAAPLANAPSVASPAAPAALDAKSATVSNLSAMSGGASARSADEHAAGPSRPSAQRVAAVKAVVKPQTGDAGLDDYSYGFRLYTAKFYPEAAQQLKLYIDKYPKGAQISHARNLLGRAYLDDGKPHDAALWFLANYKADPHGPRAADSLLNLASAMQQLGDETKACVALNEFAGSFAREAQGRLRQDYARTRGSLTCS